MRPPERLERLLRFLQLGTDRAHLRLEEHDRGVCLLLLELVAPADVGPRHRVDDAGGEVRIGALVAQREDRRVRLGPGDPQRLPQAVGRPGSLQAERVDHVFRHTAAAEDLGLRLDGRGSLQRRQQVGGVSLAVLLLHAQRGARLVHGTLAQREQQGERHDQPGGSQQPRSLAAGCRHQAVPRQRGLPVQLVHPARLRPYGPLPVESTLHQPPRSTWFYQSPQPQEIGENRPS